MSNIPLEILQGARKLLDDPKHWIKFVEARDKYGKETLADDPSATCWCSLGAICKVYKDMPFTNMQEKDKAWKFLRDSIGRYEWDYISSWNDHYTTEHWHVLAKFDRAIELAKEDCEA